MNQISFKKTAYILSAVLLIAALAGVIFTCSALAKLNVVAAMIICLFIAAETVAGGVLALLSRRVWPRHLLLLALHAVVFFPPVIATTVAYFSNK